MRHPIGLPDESIRAIGRELRLTGDLVFAGTFSTENDGGTSALFFARLFTTMLDDGCGVFIDPRTFSSARLISDQRVFNESGDVIGYVVDEMVEGSDPRTLFCGVMIRANGLSDVQHILRTSVLWPILTANDARCSSCGKDYSYRQAITWCRHMTSPSGKAVVNARVRRLVLSENKIKQTLLNMFDVDDAFADIGLESLTSMLEVFEIDGGEEDEPKITFVVSREVGYDNVTIGERSMISGQRVSIPMSMVRNVLNWDLVSSGMVIPIDHNGSIRSLFPTDAIPSVGNETEQTETRGAGS